MFDPFGGRRPVRPSEPLPQVGLSPVAPVRCPVCRSRLRWVCWVDVARRSRVRWCSSCRHTVAYVHV